MSDFDFDTLIQRRQTAAIKWQVATDELPLTIADMDFKTAPAIIAAMQAKVASGIFGYESVPPTYYTAVAQWYANQHQTKLAPAWLQFATGVIPALASLMRHFSNSGDNVVVQAPVYNTFFNVIAANGRHALSSDLQYDRQQQRYQIDWVDLAAKLADPRSTIMILCNPHNPIGQAWSPETLEHIIALCQQYQVLLVSDEIHGDLVLGTPVYTPVFKLKAAAQSKVVALVSPSKTFNLAGLHAATVITADTNLQAQLGLALQNDGLNAPNLLAVTGSIAAYSQGASWLAALKQKLTSNRQLVAQCLTQQLPQIKLASANATYLLWLDVSALTTDSAALATYLQAHTGLLLTPGNVYRGNGSQFLRLSTACPTAELQDALNRLVAGVSAFQQEA